MHNIICILHSIPLHTVSKTVQTTPSCSQKWCFWSLSLHETNSAKVLRAAARGVVVALLRREVGGLLWKKNSHIESFSCSIVTQKFHHHGRIFLEFLLNIMNWCEILWNCFVLTFFSRSWVIEGRAFVGSRWTGAQKGCRRWPLFTSGPELYFESSSWPFPSNHMIRRCNNSAKKNADHERFRIKTQIVFTSQCC